MPSYPDYGRRPDGDAPVSQRSLDERRERALEGLTTAFAADRISLDDYESRAAAVQRVTTLAELDALVDDLPAVAAPASGREAAPRRPARAPQAPRAPEMPRAPRVDPGLAGSSTVACIMGDRHLQGDWLSGDRVESFTVMGSTKIDLRDTALPDGRLRIEAFVLMGDLKIIVPRGLPVRLSAFPFMGDAKVGRDVTQRHNPGEPHLVVDGFVMMGSLNVVAMD